MIAALTLGEKVILVLTLPPAIAFVLLLGIWAWLRSEVNDSLAERAARDRELRPRVGRRTADFQTSEDSPTQPKKS